MIKLQIVYNLSTKPSVINEDEGNEIENKMIRRQHSKNESE